MEYYSSTGRGSGRGSTKRGVKVASDVNVTNVGAGPSKRVKPVEASEMPSASTDLVTWTSNDVAGFLRNGSSIDTLVAKVNGTCPSGDTNKLKGRVGEYFGGAWILFHNDKRDLRACLLDRGDPASIPPELETGLVARYPWFPKIRPNNGSTARLFDVVVVDGHGEDAVIHALLSAKWSSGVDAWLGQFRKLNEWEEDHQEQLRSIPMYLFQVVQEQGQNGNQTCRLAFGVPTRWSTGRRRSSARGPRGRRGSALGWIFCRPARVKRTRLRCRRGLLEDGNAPRATASCRKWPPPLSRASSSPGISWPRLDRARRTSSR
jgi:hypothetical protein